MARHLPDTRPAVTSIKVAVLSPYAVTVELAGVTAPWASATGFISWYGGTIPHSETFQPNQ
jgi:hypothetical protein